MTVILFIIDTSASMNQRVYSGGRPKLLDVAKNAVDVFMKNRQRIMDSRLDKYMLINFDEPPYNVKVGWKDNTNMFISEVKNLQCDGLTDLGCALKSAFDLLNLNRHANALDNYGYGRLPYCLDPTVIILITDGGKFCNSSGIVDDKNFFVPSRPAVPGSEYTMEPFRWDQRLFSLVLRLPGTLMQEKDSGLVPSDTSAIDSMCEATGGRSYCITSHKMLLQCVDSLVQKVQVGVVINFEKIGADSLYLDAIKDTKPDTDLPLDLKTQPHRSGSTSSQSTHENGYKPPPSINVIRSCGLPLPAMREPWHSCRRLILCAKNIHKGNGYWPIPEAFWPDQSFTSLPPRSAHPVIKFDCASHDPLVLESLPFDKYELEPSPLTQYILARRNPTTCWQVFIPNSYKIPDVMHPFGYLKASTNLSCVNLFVMPYNYPVLLPLLDELFKVHQRRITPEWRCNFLNYLRNTPTYYIQYLRKVLEKMGLNRATLLQILPDTEETYNPGLLTDLKNLKIQGKIDFDAKCAELANRPIPNKNMIGGERIRVTPRQPLKKDFISNPALRGKFQKLHDQLSDIMTHHVGVARSRSTIGRIGSYMNPFDIPRQNLLDQVYKMRANFLQKNSTHTKVLEDDVFHSMPVSQMGNYQDYLKKQVPPLREIESTPVRQHMFGNPFKIDKRMIIDEADIDVPGMTNAGNAGYGGSNYMRLMAGNKKNGERAVKRRVGPIPKDFQLIKKPRIEEDNASIPNNNGDLPNNLLITNGDVFANNARENEAITVPPAAGNGPVVKASVTAAAPKVDTHSESSSPIKSNASPISDEQVASNNASIPTEVSRNPATVALNGERSTGGIFQRRNLRHDHRPVQSSVPVSQTFNVPNSKQLIEEYQMIPLNDANSLRSFNYKIKRIVFHEIRKFGSKPETLFEYVRLFKGSVEQVSVHINEVIAESLRFKKQTLAYDLEKYLRTLTSSTTPLPVVVNGF